jgi:hypothetical protein
MKGGQDFRVARDVQTKNFTLNQPILSLSKDIFKQILRIDADAVVEIYPVSIRPLHYEHGYMQYAWAVLESGRSRVRYIYVGRMFPQKTQLFLDWAERNEKN